jgi:serine/threonine protein kinase
MPVTVTPAARGSTPKPKFNGPWDKDWDVVGPLSGGGQGDTLLVRNRESGLEAVLKRLKSDKARNLKARGRMHREVAALETLAAQGAKVPKYLDGNTALFKELDTHLYFVMERIVGDTLDKLMERRGPLALNESIDLCLDLCGTLGIAFKAEVSHRDIKPENLIVRSTSPADVVMLDFGLSFNKSDEGEMTEFGEALDNTFVSLPERRGPFEDKRNPKSDLTSIVAILFYCLAGFPPRNLRDSEGLTPNRSKGTKFPTVPNGPLLDHLHAFLDRGLQNDIRLRFHTVAELQSRLAELKTGEVQPPVEDFAHASSILAEDLLRIDRVSRHQSLRNSLQPVGKRLQQALSAVPKAPPFSFSVLTSVREQFPLAQLHEYEQAVFWNFAVAVKLPLREVFFVVDFVAIEEQAECRICVKIGRQKLGESRVWKTERHLLRYVPPALPSSESIEVQLQPALLEAMRLFVADIGAEQKQ